jgi:hypothetical protein
MNQDLKNMPVGELRKFLESPLPSKLFDRREWINSDIFENGRCLIKISPIAAKVSKKEAKKVLFKIASTDNTRPSLNGVYHDAENGRIVASDGERLIAIPEEGVEKSWVEDRHGREIDAHYVNWPLAMPDSGCTQERENYKGEIEILRAPVSTEYTPVEYDIDIARGAARLQKFIRQDVLLQGHSGAFYNPEKLLSVMEAFYATGSTSIELLEGDFLYLRDGDKKGVICEANLTRSDTVIIDLCTNDLM